MHMATLQVRNLPDDLHRELAARSRRLGVSMSEYVTRVLQEDLSVPAFGEWAEQVRANTSARRPIDVVGAVAAARDEDDADSQDAGRQAPARTSPSSASRPGAR